MKKIISMILVLVVVLAGCSTSEMEDDKVVIVTTIYPLYNIVEQQLEGIDESSYELINLYPSDIDPHSYQLTSENIKDVANADYVFYISDTYEEWMSDTETDAEKINITDSDLFKENVDSELYSTNVEAHSHDEDEEEHDHDEDEHDDDDELQIVDSHIFVSPKYLIDVNLVIQDELCDTDLDCEIITENYEVLNDELEEVDQMYAEFGESFDKTIYTAHDAYGYYNEYGINTVGVYGQHHDDEPSSEEVSEIIDSINEQEINTIYTEQNDESNDLVVQIANETGAEIGVLNNMSSVSQEDFDSSKSIVDILIENLEQLEKA